MNRFFIITNPQRDRDLSVTDRIRKYLTERGKEVAVHVPEEMKNGKYTDISMVPEGTECVISVGGDGTLIAVARDTAALELPILGVNQGTVGYLADAEVSQLDHALDCVIGDRFEVEERMMLEGTVMSPDGRVRKRACALNDVIIHTAGRLKVIGYQVSVNGRFLGNFRADGVIVSTPTGSTAYSMSAGGPVVEPMARMLLVTPICPHTLNARSIVFSGDDVITITMHDDGTKVHFDGVMRNTLKAEDLVEVRKSRHVTRIIRTSPNSFLTVLSNKFSG